MAQVHVMHIPEKMDAERRMKMQGILSQVEGLGHYAVDTEQTLWIGLAAKQVDAVAQALGDEGYLMNRDYWIVRGRWLMAKVNVKTMVMKED